MLTSIYRSWENGGIQLTEPAWGQGKGDEETGRRGLGSGGWPGPRGHHRQRQNDHKSRGPKLQPQHTALRGGRRAAGLPGLGSRFLKRRGGKDTDAARCGTSGLRGREQTKYLAQGALCALLTEGCGSGLRKTAPGSVRARAPWGRQEAVLGPGQGH